MIETIENRHWDFDLLPPNPLIFDCGALHGQFAKLMAEKGHRVVAFDPDAAAFGTIPQTENVIAVKKAIGYPGGRRQFYEFLPGSGANGLYLNEIEAKKNPPKLLEVDVITLEDATREYDIPSLLKMNIEGAEIEVIMNSPDELLKSIPQITVSFHGFCGFISAEQEREAQDRLRSLGFRLSFFTSPILPDDCWAIREK